MVTPKKMRTKGGMFLGFSRIPKVSLLYGGISLDLAKEEKRGRKG